MKSLRTWFTFLAFLFAASAFAEETLIRYEISLTAAGATPGVGIAAQRLAANYGASVESSTINEQSATFVMTITTQSAPLLQGDPRIRSMRSLSSRAHTSVQPLDLDLGVYAYDGSGDIQSIGADQFRYDLAGRLTSGTVNGSANKQTYTYDGFGNRVDATRTTTAATCIANTACEMSAPVTTTTGTNHLASTRATYDDAGNVTTLDGTYTYTYDALNMVKHTGTHDYIYTADDERIASVASGVWTWTLRNPSQQVIREFTSMGTDGTQNWSWTRDHIWRGASLLAVEEKTPAGATVTRHFHLDHLGTPRLVTNGSGQRIGLHANYPFGTELLSSTTESPADNIKFTGHEWDDLGGDIHALTYMHARYYSAAMGRFLSVDPVLDQKFAVSHPQAWNRYSYVRNNPLRLVDPTGKNADVTCDAKQNCTVTVQAQIALDMKDKKQVAAANAFASGATTYWNRQQVKGPHGQNLTFNVQFAMVQNGTQKTGMDTLNVVTGAGRSKVDMTLDIGLPGPLTPDKGMIYTQDTTNSPSGMAGIAAHETGT